MKLSRILFLFLGLAIACGGAACGTQPGAPPKAAPTCSTSFVAGNGIGVKADYRADESVTLTFADGRTQKLKRAVSASGARYVAGQDEWWEHQGEATYRRNDKLVFSGKRK